MRARKIAVVTGAAGFLGSHLVDRLLDDGFQVVGLDNLLTGSLDNLRRAAKDPRFAFRVADVREPLGVRADVIFNLACPASPPHYQADPFGTLTTSVLGAQRVLEAARDRACRVVQASTSEVYGDPVEHPQRETYWGHVNPIGERACYDEGKRCAEAMLMDARRRWKVDVRIARIFNTYGPRMSPDDGRVVSNFVVQALRGEPITIYGEGTQTRSFCYVDDLVGGLLSLSRVEDVPGPINLGNPGEFTIAQLAEEVSKLVGRPLDVTRAPLPADDPKQRRPDISLARSLLGFEPKVSLRDGLAPTIEYFRARIAEPA